MGARGCETSLQKPAEVCIGAVPADHQCFVLQQPSFLDPASGIAALAEEPAGESGGETEPPEETAAPGEGQDSPPRETVAPDDTSSKQPDETVAPGGAHGPEPREPRSGWRQDGQPEGTPAPGGGQDGQPEGTPAPGGGQDGQPEGTPAPDGMLNAEAEATHAPAALTSKADMAVKIYIGPKDPQVEAEDEVIDLNTKVKKLALYAIVTPEGSAQAIDWFTSNKKVASIRPSGTDCVVTGLKSGVVTITARVKGRSDIWDTCTVTVAGLAKSISVSGRGIGLGIHREVYRIGLAQGNHQQGGRLVLGRRRRGDHRPGHGDADGEGRGRRHGCERHGHGQGLGRRRLRALSGHRAAQVHGGRGPAERRNHRQRVDLPVREQKARADGGGQARGRQAGRILVLTNPKVAKVDRKGVVTGIKAGQSVIRATSADGLTYKEIALTVMTGRASGLNTTGRSPPFTPTGIPVADTWDTPIRGTHRWAPARLGNGAWN